MNRIDKLQPLNLRGLSYVLSNYTESYIKDIGGEGGIRTLDTLLTYTPLAGERLQPLGHFTVQILVISTLKKMVAYRVRFF